MSSGLPGVAEKLDLRKYLLVLRRRKWWGAVPFVFFACLFTAMCSSLQPKYVSTCMIRATKSEVAEIYGPGASRKVRTSLAVVNEEMLRYKEVMDALAKAREIFADLERRSKGDSALRSKLQDELYDEIVRNTYTRLIGEGLISVSYIAYEPENARLTLDSLVTHFVENALKNEWQAATKARDLAFAELSKAKQWLEQAENSLITFNEQHPRVQGAPEGSSREAFSKVKADREAFEREISAKQKMLQRYIEQLEEMPQQTVEEVRSTLSPEVQVRRTRLADLQSQLAISLRTMTPLHPSVKMLQKQIEAAEQDLSNARQQTGEDEIILSRNKVREQLEEKKLGLEAELEYQMTVRDDLRLREAALDEEVHAMPGWQRDLARHEREKAAAASRHATALQNFNRIDQEYSMKMEGLMSFSVVSPARTPQSKDVRHIVKMAILGFFVSVGAALAAIAGTEFLDQSFTDVEVARDFLKLPSLGIIPYIETAGHRRSRKLRYALVTSAVVAVLVTLTFVVWLRVQPFHQAALGLWDLVGRLARSVVR